MLVAQLQVTILYIRCPNAYSMLSPAIQVLRRGSKRLGDTRKEHEGGLQMWAQGAVGLVGGCKGVGGGGSGAGGALRDMAGAAAAGAGPTLGRPLARLLGTRPRQCLVSRPQHSPVALVLLQHLVWVMWWVSFW